MKAISVIYVALFAAVVLMTLVITVGESHKRRDQQPIAIECVKSGGEWIEDGWPPHGCIRKAMKQE